MQMPRHGAAKITDKIVPFETLDITTRVRDGAFSEFQIFGFGAKV